MSDRSDVIFVYDGSFDGLMCCIYHCYYEKTMPCAIRLEDEEQLMLGAYMDIITDCEKAERVRSAIKTKLGGDFLKIVQRLSLSFEEDRELLILKFVILGFKYGRRVLSMLADNTVNRVMKVESYVAKEAHLSLEFLRFSDYGGVLVAVIEPKNTVLPLIADHFADRLRPERFMIFDKNHKMAVIHEPGRTEIIYIDSLELPRASEEERKFRALWRSFYNIIGIKERYNPRCRMNHCPKRYWGNMTEFNDDEDIYSDNPSLSEGVLLSDDVISSADMPSVLPVSSESSTEV